MLIRSNFPGTWRLEPSVAAALFVAWLWSSNGFAAPKIILHDPAYLAAARRCVGEGDPQLAPAVARLRDDAEHALHAGPFSVVNKQAVPKSGDKHDYMSLGPYWWPNPETPDGLPYVRHDGRRYPGIRELPNRTDLGQMTGAVETLSLAYYFTGDERFADRAALLIRAWFLDPKTRMNPNLNYGQAIRGVNDGRGVGIIETRSFANVLDSVGLLADSSAWTEADQRGLVAWFDQYFNWLLESDLGRDERAAKNNHGTYFDIQAASFAYFVGKTDLATEVLRDVGPRRIAVQIEPDGRQPLELERTNAWSYSIGNLTGLVTLARMADNFDVDLWNYHTADGRSLAKAIDFLLPFGTGQRDWEYQQISGFSPDSFYPLLRTAAEKYPTGPYINRLADVPPQETSSRSRLLQGPLAIQQAGTRRP
jgi:Alginate lyase